MLPPPVTQLQTIVPLVIGQHERTHTHDSGVKARNDFYDDFGNVSLVMMVMIYISGKARITKRDSHCNLVHCGEECLEHPAKRLNCKTHIHSARNIPTKCEYLITM